MNGEISTLGWVILIVLAVFIVSINVALITSARKKPGKTTWIEHIQKANQSIKQSWKKEDHDLEELSELTNHLKEQNKKESD